MKIFEKIKNWKQPRLYWKNIFRYYLDQTFFQKASVEIVNPGEDRSVLVLCPHIDDDVIGLGGTLYQYHLSGVPVTVVYFSSGNERRKKEGRQIGDFLGYREVLFYDYPPEQLSGYKEIQAEIESLLKKNAYDVIYVPFYLDRHKDHIALSCHFARVMARLPGYETEVRSYEVWSPLFPSKIVDISDVVENKKKGIQICQSQMESVNYVDMALALNRYRGMTSTRTKKIEYAEGFFACSPSLYLKLFPYKEFLT